jgi:hypothetical protein
LSTAALIRAWVESPPPDAAIVGEDFKLCPVMRFKHIRKRKPDRMFT